MQGRVLRFDRKSGWGFALPDDLSSDVFLHRRNLPDNHRFLNEGDRISYDLGLRDGKPIALNIQIVAEAPRPVVDGAR